MRHNRGHRTGPRRVHPGAPTARPRLSHRAVGRRRSRPHYCHAGPARRRAAPVACYPRYHHHVSVLRSKRCENGPERNERHGAGRNSVPLVGCQGRFSCGPFSMRRLTDNALGDARTSKVAADIDRKHLLLTRYTVFARIHLCTTRTAHERLKVSAYSELDGTFALLLSAIRYNHRNYQLTYEEAS